MNTIPQWLDSIWPLSWDDPLAHWSNTCLPKWIPACTTSVSKWHVSEDLANEPFYLFSPHPNYINSLTKPTQIHDLFKKQKVHPVKTKYFFQRLSCVAGQNRRWKSKTWLQRTRLTEWSPFQISIMGWQQFITLLMQERTWHGPQLMASIETGWFTMLANTSCVAIRDVFVILRDYSLSKLYGYALGFLNHSDHHSNVNHCTLSCHSSFSEFFACILLACWG